MKHCARNPLQLLTPAFAGNLEPLLDGSRVSLRIHGHMHDPVDYTVNGGRVLCNPRGYPGEPGGSRFDPAMCVELVNKPVRS